MYDSSKQSIISDLFQPTLTESVLYQRGVGFFTSGWLKLNLKGIKNLIERKGRAEIVTSPHITDIDLEAIQRGELARDDQFLYELLFKEINRLQASTDEETLTLLSWLIADGLLEMKFAIPINGIGDFHDKFAVFTDEAGDQVAIHGSYNDSIHANYNGESFSVYCSWIEGQAPYVEKHLERFTNLFYGRNDFFRIYKMPELLHEKLVRITQQFVRPYDIKKTAVIRPLVEKNKIRIPPDKSLFEYQKKAILEWKQNDHQGLFSMATGTGKTITSLAASAIIYRERRKIGLIISVPFKHLVEQWKEEAEAFGYEPILSTEKNWLFKVNARIDDFNLGLEDVFCFIITHQSNANENKFLRLVSKIRDKSNIVFIGDEAHYLGAGYLRNTLHPEIQMRLGLSATPERWRDPSGTKVVTEYFSKEVISFGLERAIEEGYLTPYDFIPNYVEMGESEYVEYKKLSIRISRLLQAAKKDPRKRDMANLFAVQRANIINKSESKTDAFLALLREHVREIGWENFSHTLVYSPEGKHQEILRHIADLGLRVQEIVASTNNSDRKRILQMFDQGEIQVIVAMKCLDEGVNVPSTKRAYFLASTTNPRQFIQRRGRILRKSFGKSKAFIYDFVMIPPRNLYDEGTTQEQLVKREFTRFIEFYVCANNRIGIQNEAYQILERYKLGFLLSLRPEEIYSSLQEELENNEN